MKNLYIKLDEYAFQEDIIEKSYAQYITIDNTYRLSKNIKKRTPYSYEQIKYLWDIKSENL